MKPTTSYRFRGTWSYLITACIAYLSILYRSDVLAATLRIPLARSNVTSPAISPYRLSSTAAPIPINQPEGLQERVPNDILAEILHLDNLKCFPKLLCTIYQDPQVTRQGFFVNSTELALAYIKLIRAVHYTSPSRTTTEAPRKRKKPIIQVFKIPHGLITASTNLGRKDHLHRIFREDDDDLHDNFPRYPYPLRSPTSFYNDQDEDDDDSYSYFYGRNRDDEEAREFLREKVQISQLMKDLKDEDNDELLEDSPDGLATTLLSSYLPFVGSRPRRRRERSVYTYPRISHRSGRRRSQKHQDPFWKAVTMWKKLKRRNECQALYKTCPFEAWEIVRMLDLVRGQANVLSAYLKITVDKVKPKRKRQ